MLWRTHLVANLFFALLLLDFFENKFIFLFAVLISSFIPDLDSRFSKVGKKKIFRPIQWFAGHRKIFHSFIFLILICIGIWFLSRTFAHGLFLGYSLHLFFDMLTIQGIQPFYPFEFKVNGFFKTGKLFENLIFVLFFVGCCFLVFKKFGFLNVYV